MNTLRLGSKRSSDLDFLIKLMEIDFNNNEFDSELDTKVKKYQKENGLLSDGVVGYKTWKSLILNYRKKHKSSPDIQEWDYEMFGKLLGVNPACLKAVQKVETGGKGGFERNGKPQILFEGHVFWRELTKIGIDPVKIQSGNENILYKTWTKSKYVGGPGEWIRFEKAKNINESAAIKSASWGMFQIMGNNYVLCGCTNIKEFYNLMCKDKFSQFLLGMEFLKQSKLIPYLVKQDWAGFAKGYNGPNYAKNSYDKRLRDAFLSFFK